MHMRARGPAGRTHQRDPFASPHEFAHVHENPLVVSVHGHVAITVIDLDEIAKAAIQSCPRHKSWSGRLHRFALGGRKIDARMERQFARERVDAHAERRTFIALQDRRSGGQSVQLYIAAHQNAFQGTQLLFAIADLRRKLAEAVHEIRQRHVIDRCAYLGTAFGRRLVEIEFSRLDAGHPGKLLAQCIQTDDMRLQFTHFGRQGIDTRLGDPFRMRDFPGLGTELRLPRRGPYRGRIEHTGGAIAGHEQGGYQQPAESRGERPDERTSRIELAHASMFYEYNKAHLRFPNLADRLPMTVPKSRSLDALLAEGGSRLRLLAAEAARLNTLGDQVRRQLPAALQPHCLGAELETGTLVIYMDSPATAAPIRYQQRELLAKFAAVNLICTALRVQVLPEPPVAPAPKPAVRTLPDPVRQILESTAAGLDEGPLSRALLRLARGSTRRP